MHERRATRPSLRAAAATQESGLDGGDSLDVDHVFVRRAAEVDLMMALRYE